MFWNGLWKTREWNERFFTARVKKVVHKSEHCVGCRRYPLSDKEQELFINPGEIIYFPAGMCHSVETIEKGISINISLMSVNYASLVSSAIHHFLINKDAWRQNDVDNSCLCGPNNATETLNSLIQQLP